jgi:hypothetical protein
MKFHVPFVCVLVLAICQIGTAVEHSPSPPCSTANLVDVATGNTCSSICVPDGGIFELCNGILGPYNVIYLFTNDGPDGYFTFNTCGSSLNTFLIAADVSNVTKILDCSGGRDPPYDPVCATDGTYETAVLDHVFVAAGQTIQILLGVSNELGYTYNPPCGDYQITATRENICDSCQGQFVCVPLLVSGNSYCAPTPILAEPYVVCFSCNASVLPNGQVYTPLAVTFNTCNVTANPITQNLASDCLTDVTSGWNYHHILSKAVMTIDTCGSDYVVSVLVTNVYSGGNLSTCYSDRNLDVPPAPFCATNATFVAGFIVNTGDYVTIFTGEESTCGNVTLSFKTTPVCSWCPGAYACEYDKYQSLGCGDFDPNANRCTHCPPLLGEGVDPCTTNLLPGGMLRVTSTALHHTAHTRPQMILSQHSIYSLPNQVKLGGGSGDLDRVSLALMAVCCMSRRNWVRIPSAVSTIGQKSPMGRSMFETRECGFSCCA